MGRVSDLDLTQLFFVRLRMSWNFWARKKNFSFPFHLLLLGHMMHHIVIGHQLPCFLACCCALTFPMEATAFFGLDRTTLILCRFSMAAASFGMNFFFSTILLFLFVPSLIDSRSSCV